MASQKREEAMASAKAYLMTRKNANGLSVYDHMTRMLQHYIAEKPDDPIAVFGHVSDKVGLETFTPPRDAIQHHSVVPEVLQTAQREQLQISEVASAASDAGVEDVAETMEDPIPNILQNASYFESGGVGLSPEETYRIFVALKHLSQQKQFLDKVRFWGKMFGLKKNYIIAEGELKPNTDEERDEEMEEENVEEGEEEEEIVPEEGDEAEAATNKKKRTPLPVPPEPTGVGCNVKIYYYCNEPGEKWVRLPNAHPDHIRVARKIKKYLTGNPKAEIHSYPPFKGTEADYLRSQIARISASTIISPSGYFAPSEEEEEEGEEAPENLELNPEYEPLSNQDLMDSLANWVHHVKHVLPQGRCTWFDPLPHIEEDFADDEEDDDDDDASRPSASNLDPIEPESGPGLLTPISDDNSPCLGGAPAWTLIKTLTILPQHSHVVLQSNIWPGAYTAGTGKTFDSIYIGYGLKYEREPFSPVMPPPPQKEVPTEPGVLEANDPTVEDEETARKRAEDGDDEDGEDGEEEEEEEEDD